MRSHVEKIYHRPYWPFCIPIWNTSGSATLCPALRCRSFTPPYTSDSSHFNAFITAPLFPRLNRRPPSNCLPRSGPVRIRCTSAARSLCVLLHPVTIFVYGAFEMARIYPLVDRPGYILRHRRAECISLAQHSLLLHPPHSLCFQRLLPVLPPAMPARTPRQTLRDSTSPNHDPEVCFPLSRVSTAFHRYPTSC